MAELSLPDVTMSVFGFRVDDSGRTIYESAYSADEYRVGPGWTRLAGTVQFAPVSWEEDAALHGFLLDLDGD